MKLVCLSGNHTRPSRTRVVMDAVARSAAAKGWDVEVFDLGDAGPTLGATFSRDTASDGHKRIWDALQTCDALAVGSPVYKASYSGLLKHLFDVLDVNVLKGKPVLLAATAKAPEHALMIDHQMRPLFAFFQAPTIPTGLFATDADFQDPSTLATGMATRLERAVEGLTRFAGVTR